MLTILFQMNHVYVFYIVLKLYRFLFNFYFTINSLMHCNFAGYELVYIMLLCYYIERIMYNIITCV